MAPKTLTMRVAVTAALLGAVLSITSCSSSQADGKVTIVRPREAVSLIESGHYVVLDLRASDSFRSSHVVGARSVPFLTGWFEKRLPELDPSRRYLLYAKDPDVADRAADMMVAHDFQHVVDAGRFGLLALAGAPIE